MTLNTTAPVWRRLAALLYDSFILLALSFAYGALTTAGKVVLGGVGDQDYQPMFHSGIYLAGWLMVLASFYAWFWRRGGQTLGMRAWRIELRNSDDSAPPTWMAIGLRLIVSPFCVALFGLGYWAKWVIPGHHCLQDRLSDTQVILLTRGR